MAALFSKGKKVKPTTAVSIIENVSPFSLTSTNPIRLSKKQFQKLVDDIKLNGIKTPVKVTTKDNITYIVNGNHRTYIAKRLGKDVPIEKIPYEEGMEIIQEGGNPGYLKYIKY